ncbi:hypothetical protein [Lactococcus taiwanensis]|uniref:hypothetical protein n=1 Tax=Lactococcus taiwanensis TaxID=1151742 RepID=UPI003514E14D
MKIELTEDEFRYFRSTVIDDIEYHRLNIKKYEAQMQFLDIPNYQQFYRTEIKRTKSMVDKLSTTLNKFEKYEVLE